MVTYFFYLELTNTRKKFLACPLIGLTSGNSVQAHAAGHQSMSFQMAVAILVDNRTKQIYPDPQI